MILEKTQKLKIPLHIDYYLHVSQLLFYFLRFFAFKLSKKLEIYDFKIIYFVIFCSIFVFISYVLISTKAQKNNKKT